MPSCYVTPLSDRATVQVTGPDAEVFLQDLLAGDISGISAPAGLRHTGLLTPQGKILFAFFVFGRDVDGHPAYLIDCRAEHAADLTKRLRFYKLRRAVEIDDVSDHYATGVLWGEAAPDGAPEFISLCPDPRHAGMGMRFIGPRETVSNAKSVFCEHDGACTVIAAAEDDYHAHRIALAIPEDGLDYPLGNTFPHEALWDVIGSVDFKKGCFIGQEVVSRMQHRGTARKRIVGIQSAEQLLPGSEIKAGEATIGTVGSVAGTRALAMVRLDRAAQALKTNQPITAEAQEIRLVLADWLPFSIADYSPADAP